MYSTTCNWNAQIYHTGQGAAMARIVEADKKKGLGSEGRGPLNPAIQNGTSCTAAPCGSVAVSEAEASASGSFSPRFSLRIESARICQTVCFTVVAFLPLPYSRS